MELDGIYQSLYEIFGTTTPGRCMIIFMISVLPGVGNPITTIQIGVFALGLPVMLSAATCFIGNIFPVPFIILFIRKIFAWMRKISKTLGRLADRFEEKAKSKGVKLRRGVFIGLLLFVAIPLPLPGMGAWTGALIAAIFDIRLKTAMAAISIGVLITCVISITVAYGIISLGSWT